MSRKSVTKEPSELPMRLSLVERLKLLSDLILADGRRVKLKRMAIVMNVTYTVIFGVILFVESLKLISTGALMSIYLRKSMAKMLFLMIVISGHLSGLFGITHKKRILLLISAGIGLASAVIYLCLIAYNLYSIPIVVIMLGAVVSHTQLSLCFISFIIAINLHRKPRQILI